MNKVRTTVSHSEVESFLRCTRAHYYGYILEIMRRDTSDSLARGTIGHTALETYFKTVKAEQASGSSYAEAVEKAKVEVGKVMIEMFMLNPTLAAQVQDTLDWFYKAEPFKFWEILYVEEDFMFEISDRLQMPFKPDLIARDPEGKVWLIDNKVVYDFYTPRDAELQPQLAKYYFALRSLGIHIDKVGYHSLRWRNLKENTTENRNSLFGFDMPKDRAITTMTEQIFASKEIQRRKALPLAEANGQALRAANKLVCNNCSFRSLCIAEQNNEKPQLVLDSEYVKRERIVYEDKTDGE